MLEIGSTIDGKYKILNVIGKGGMSVVYLAVNEKANKPWAIKEVRKSGVRDFEVVRQSLLVEIDLLKKLRHPGLPSIIDVIEQDDNYLIVMDYIEGNTLEKRLREYGAQPQDKVVKWAIQLCDVLHYLHTRKPAIIYRDMKPSNIMVQSDGSVVLIDFGTAREFKERNLGDTTCLGTQGYAAPEQFGGMGQTDARTDIYSLGATMYHLVTGHNPSEPPYEMYPITSWNPNLSTGLEGIISKCTQRNPQDRYQSILDLKYALENYRNLDIDVLKKSKRKLALFTASAAITVASVILSGICYANALKVQKNDYMYYIEAAQKSTTDDDTISYYMDAIKTDCVRKEAYSGLIETFSADGVFDEKEERTLLQLTISVDKYMKTFQNSNPKEYAEICYDIGSTYWFYYEHEANRQSNAVPWFQSAADYFETNDEKSMEWKRAKIFIEIGNFYKKVIPAQIDGSDSGMYGEYWNNLIELKKMNDENPDRALINLRFYKEIVTRTLEYSRYLLDDGISYEEINDVLESIQEEIVSMEINASENELAEIKRIKELILSARDMISSSVSNMKY